MGDKFVVHHKSHLRGEDKAVTMTLRLDKDLQKRYDILADKSGRSRNQLMCMALQYAIDNLEFIPENEE